MSLQSEMYEVSVAEPLCSAAPSDSDHSSLFVFHLEGNECINKNAKHCGECIQTGAKCGWCTDPVCNSELHLLQTNAQGFNHVFLFYRMLRFT